MEIWKRCWNVLQKFVSPNGGKVCREHAEEARISKQLVRLRSDAPMPILPEDFARPHPDFSTLLPFLEKMEFQRLTAMVKSRMAENGHDSSKKIDHPSQDPHASPRRYQLVQDVTDLQKWVERAFAAGIVAIDTETNSLNALQAQLVGISLSVAPGDACYIPLRHRPQDQGDFRGSERTRSSSFPYRLLRKCYALF